MKKAREILLNDRLTQFGSGHFRQILCKNVTHAENEFNDMTYLVKNIFFFQLKKLYFILMNSQSKFFPLIHVYLRFFFFSFYQDFYFLSVLTFYPPKYNTIQLNKGCITYNFIQWKGRYKFTLLPGRKKKIILRVKTQNKTL
jgi:hypothetical protein